MKNLPWGRRAEKEWLAPPIVRGPVGPVDVGSPPGIEVVIPRTVATIVVGWIIVIVRIAPIVRQAPRAVVVRFGIPIVINVVCSTRREPVVVAHRVVRTTRNLTIG